MSARHPKQRRTPSRLSRQLSATTASFPKLLRLSRSDSGYSSDGQQLPAGSDTSASLDKQLETAEHADPAESSSERHLLSIKYALLMEHEKCRHALMLAAEPWETHQVRDMPDYPDGEQTREEGEEEAEPAISKRKRKSMPSSRSDSAADDRFFHNLMEQSRRDRYESDWRRDWQRRTYDGERYGCRNNLDYRY